MPAFFSGGNRFFDVVNTLYEDYEQNHDYSYICIVFAAMYLESVINEVIFDNRLIADLIQVELGKYLKTIEIDIYGRHDPLPAKVKAIFSYYIVKGFENDKEYIEMLHLFSLRNELVHLKPIKHTRAYTQEIKLAKKALNYLHKNLKIIDNPFERGVYWLEVLRNKDVCLWARQVPLQSIDYLYNRTFKPPFGDLRLDWQCQLYNMGRWRKVASDT